MIKNTDFFEIVNFDWNYYLRTDFKLQEVVYESLEGFCRFYKQKLQLCLHSKFYLPNDEITLIVVESLYKGYGVMFECTSSVNRYAVINAFFQSRFRQLIILDSSIVLLCSDKITARTIFWGSFYL